jgi:hypothetical protein
MCIIFMGQMRNGPTELEFFPLLDLGPIKFFLLLLGYIVENPPPPLLPHLASTCASVTLTLKLVCTQAAYAEKIVESWETMTEETSRYARKSDTTAS